MTLDPVHVDEIAALARLIERDMAADDHTDLAMQVWETALDPLQVDGRTILEPVDGQVRRQVSIDDIALTESPFPTQHALDSGTMNPTTFTNGAVIDLAHAAMAREPSDQDVHRARTIVGTIHHGDARQHIPEEWQPFDEGYGRRKWLRVPRVTRFAEGVVHSLALAHAETTHASEHLDRVEDLLILDGPIYPKEILRWEDRHPTLREQLHGDVLPQVVIQSAVDLVAESLERELPVCGFVKNPSSNRLTRAIRSRGMPAPWFNDAAMFRRILGGEADDATLYCTNWFVSHAGTDRPFAEPERSALELSLPDPSWRFAVTWMVLFDPRDDMIYRVEAPHGVTADPDVRDRLTRLLLRAVAAERGPPRAVQKADSLARIGRGEKRSLRAAFEAEWNTVVDRTYDDKRWGGDDTAR